MKNRAKIGHFNTYNLHFSLSFSKFRALALTENGHRVFLSLVILLKLT